MDDTAGVLTKEVLDNAMREIMSRPVKQTILVSPYGHGAFGIIMRGTTSNWNWRRVKRELRRFDAGKPRLYDLG